MYNIMLAIISKLRMFICLWKINRLKNVRNACNMQKYIKHLTL